MNHSLHKQFLEINSQEPAIVIGENHSVLFEELVDYFDEEIYHSLLRCSILSYFVRCETFEDPDIPKSVISSAIQKEMGASQQPSQSSKLCYEFLAGKVPTQVHESGPEVRNLMHVWTQGLDRFKSYCSTKIFYPVYSVKRNVGHATQELYCLRTDSPENGLMYKTVDLLRHYHETGEMIGGPMEVRYAWRRNDLGPRVYYCSGGEAYFSSLYMKEIAKELCNILPCSNVFTRFDPTRVTVHPLTEEELLVTYDYSSFTTSLSELKYCLFHLGMALSGYRIRVLDVHLGVQELDLGLYLLQYNEEINHNAPFDYSRLEDASPLTAVLYQGRSGMLGAQGNIGFSTLTHAFSLAGIHDDPTYTSCVGDDALLKTTDLCFETTVAHCVDLCEIQEKKFHKFPLPKDEEDSILESWIYLKRPIRVTPSGVISTGFLGDLPNISEVLQLPDTYHTKSHTSPKDKITSFIGQCSVFLKRLQSRYRFDNISEEEANEFLLLFRRVYTLVGLEHKGSLPGYTIKSGLYKGISIPVFVPPMSLRILMEDWEEILCQKYIGSRFLFPDFSNHTIPAPYCVGFGDTITATPHRDQRMMVLLGYFLEVKQMKEYIVDADTAQFMKDLVSGQLRPLISYTCIKNPPDWYNECLTYYISSPSNDDEELVGTSLEHLML